jgi:hypothetical protein
MLILTKRSFMQRALDYVRLGYIHYTVGVIPLTKTEDLVKKFKHKYRVDLDRNRRRRAKQQGHGSAFLLLRWDDQSRNTVAWTLLVSKGDHPAHDSETLRDATKMPVTVTGYELVRLTKNIRRKTKIKIAPIDSDTTQKTIQTTPTEETHGKEVLTWRMTRSNYERWREELISAVRSLKPIDPIVAELFRSPGFWGIRSQIGKLTQLIRAEWKRTRADNSAGPKLPRHLPYVTRLKSKGTLISAALNGSTEIE